jgi:hypothetical protein
MYIAYLKIRRVPRIFKYGEAKADKSRGIKGYEMGTDAINRVSNSYKPCCSFSVCVSNRVFTFHLCIQKPPNRNLPSL